MVTSEILNSEFKTQDLVDLLVKIYLTEKEKLLIMLLGGEGYFLNIGKLSNIANFEQEIHSLSDKNIIEINQNLGNICLTSTGKLICDGIFKLLI